MHLSKVFCFDVLVLLAVVYCCSAWGIKGLLDVGDAKPGFGARVTPAGLDFLRDLGLKTLHDEVSKLQIPDISGSSDIGIGDVDYTVSNIHVDSFDIPSATIATKANVGVTVSASGISLSISGDWKYKLHGLIPASDSGTFDASASGMSLSLTVEIGVDSSGRPTVKSTSDDCSFNINDMSITLHGGASWLYNLFDDQIADSLKDSLNGQVCGIVINEVNTDLEKQLSTLTIVAGITSTAEIDYSMVSTPLFNTSISTFHKGEVYQIGHHTEAPIPIPTVPNDPDESHMLFMWLTDYTPNTACYVLHQTGFLRYNVTPDEVPSGSPFSLNTSNFGIKFAIPQLAKKYPNMLMQLNLNTTAPPKVTTTPDKITAFMEGDIAVYVIQPNKTLAYAFTLNGSMNVSASVGFKGSNLTWTLSYLSTGLKLVHSEIGEFTLTKLKTGLDLAVKTYVIPLLNKKGAEGIPLPSMEGYTASKPTVTQGKGFLKIGMDLIYNPSGQRSRK